LDSYLSDYKVKGQIVCNKEILEPLSKWDFYNMLNIVNVSEDDSTYIVDFEDVFPHPEYPKLISFIVKNSDIEKGSIYIRNFSFTDCDDEIITKDASYCFISNGLPNTTRIFDSTKVEILSNNYPNPFSESTKIYFTVEKKSQISLSIYDVLGNKVETLLSSQAKPGKYEYEYKPKLLSQGVYFIVYQVDGTIYSRKAMYFK
jgi:hypothetical protein